jgi:putative ABC transport system substrate-binding protein
MTTQPLSALRMLLSRHTKRREFITLLGGAAAWPVAAGAQQAARLPTIGFEAASSSSPWTAAFVQRLRELGWIEGRTIAIEYCSPEGNSARHAEIAAEFVRLKVDVIVSSSIAVPTFKRATEVIPIVFALGTDPLGGGVIASLARPGGNVTGLSSLSTDIASKRLELLREAVPDIRRLAVIANAGYPQAVLEVDEVKAAARTLGIAIASLEIRRAEDIAPAFKGLKADALYAAGDALVHANRTRILTFALSARLPTIFNNRLSVEAGALISYGPNFSNQFRRTAESVDKIFYAEQSPPKSRSSSRPNSISSSTSPPRKLSASRFRLCCSPASTRSSNKLAAAFILLHSLTTGYGTELPIQNVRSSAAIGGVEWTTYARCEFFAF